MHRKMNKELYCQLLLSIQRNFTMTAMAEVAPVSHDQIDYWARGKRLTPKILWEYAKPFVVQQSGYLVADDMVIDKDYGPAIELTHTTYSLTDGGLVNGINLTSLVWSDGESHIPCNYRVYAPELDGKTKNDHLREMLAWAARQEFQPKAVLFDAWYATVGNLKAVAAYGWTWIAELKNNRIVNKGVSLKTMTIPEEGIVIHLKAYGMVKVVTRVTPDGRSSYLATNNLALTADEIAQGYTERWKIEEYHRGLKQVTGIEQCQATTGRIQKNHIFCSVLAFLALEVKRMNEGVSWYQAKASIVKDAIRCYLKQPTISLQFT